MKEKSPAFQFYPKDFLADANVMAMTMEERGCYITLLCTCWNERGLPAQPEKLAKLLGYTVARLNRIWPALSPCFAPTGDGRLVHPRLLKELEKQDAFSRKMRAAAAKSVVSRRSRKVQPKHSLPSANVEPTHNSASADKADALGANVPERRAAALPAAPGPKLVQLTGTQVEQRRRDFRALRGEA